MKSTIAIMAGMAALGGIFHLGSQLLAQQAGYPPQNPQQQFQQPQFQQPPRPPVVTVPSVSSGSPRIAVINLGQVFKNCQKFKTFQMDMTRKTQELQYQYDGMKKQIMDKQTELNDPKTQMLPQRREQLENEMKDLQRRMQFMAEDAKQRLGKEEFDHLVATYKEVKEQVAKVAAARNIDLVLHYMDGVAADEFLPSIFQRKLANGACWPMYMAPGIDITREVYESLNAKFAPAAMAPTGGNQR